MGERMLGSDDARDSWTSTRAAHLLGIDYPIIQAPFGGLASQRLTAAVSNVGGLGSLGALTLGPSSISEVINEIRSLTGKPFAINLWVSTSDREASRISSNRMEEKIHELRGYYAELGIEAPSIVEPRYQDFEAQAHAAIDARPAVLSFVYGIPPTEILDECRRQKIRTIGTATDARRSYSSRAGRARADRGVRLRRGWSPQLISSFPNGLPYGRLFAHSSGGGCCFSSSDSSRWDRRSSRFGGRTRIGG